MSDHIQNKLIHLQWQIGTYQSHIKYIQGQIRLIHRLIHLVIVLLNFRFQKCHDPNPRLDPVGESKPEPGLLRHFQLSSQNILFGFIKFSFSKCRDPNPRLDPVGESKPEPGLLLHFQLSSQNILFVLFHFRLFNYAEALNYGQAHKHLQLTKCIYKIMPLHPLYSCYSFSHAFILQIIYHITTCIFYAIIQFTIQFMIFKHIHKNPIYTRQCWLFHFDYSIHISDGFRLMNPALIIIR